MVGKLTKREARRLSDEALINDLHIRRSDAQFLRDELSRRLSRDGFPDAHSWIVAPYVNDMDKLKRTIRQLEAQIRDLEGTAPQTAPNDDRELHELAAAMLQSGWGGDGMRDTRNLRARLRVAVDTRQTWHGLENLKNADSARAFWEAAIYHWRVWQEQEREEYDDV